jgi:hypothetical protein
MESRHSKGHSLFVVGLAVTCAFSLTPCNVYGAAYLAPPLTLVDRAVTQDQGAWVIDYRLRNAASAGVIVSPDDIGLRVEGWVSNSRVASHAVPRWSSLVITTHVDSTTCSDVIQSVDESQRCRERLVISVRSDGRSPSDRSSTAKIADSPTTANASPASSALIPIPVLSLGPGEMMHLRLRIDHQHILYGEYDPLLGIRTIELTLGESVIRDVLPLDREQYLAQPQYIWPEPPDVRRDTRQFISAPDSLHIEADVQGHRSYRYQERPVRYNTKMKLRFWYLIAAGTEGECCVRVGQNKDTPLAWRQLHEAGFEDRLKTIGRWTKYERIFQTEPEATRLVLEFKIGGEIDIGEMWIDDVRMEPLGITGPGGP